LPGGSATSRRRAGVQLEGHRKPKIIARLVEYSCDPPGRGRKNLGDPAKKDARGRAIGKRGTLRQGDGRDLVREGEKKEGWEAKGKEDRKAEKTPSNLP